MEPVTIVVGAAAAYGIYRWLRKPSAPVLDTSTPPPPTLPIDVKTARAYSRKAAEDYTRYLGFYDQALMARFKGAAGLRTAKGKVNPVYAGTTAGAMRVFGVANPPSPLPGKLPAQMVPYRMPQSGHAGVGFEPTAIIGGLLGAINFALGLASLIEKAEWEDYAEDTATGFQGWKVTLRQLDELAATNPALRVRGTDRMYRHVLAVANSTWRDNPEERTWQTPVGRVLFPYVDYSKLPDPYYFAFPFFDRQGRVLGDLLNVADDVALALTGGHPFAAIDPGAPVLKDEPGWFPTDPVFLRAFTDPLSVAAELDLTPSESITNRPRLDALRWMGWTSFPDADNANRWPAMSGIEETNAIQSTEFLKRTAKDQAFQAMLRESIMLAVNDPWLYFPLDPAETSAQQKLAGGYSIPLSVKARTDDKGALVGVVPFYGEAGGGLSSAVGTIPPPPLSTDQLFVKLRGMNPYGGYDHALVALFQQRVGLRITGELDAATLARLDPGYADPAIAARDAKTKGKTSEELLQIIRDSYKETTPDKQLGVAGPNETGQTIGKTGRELRQYILGQLSALTRIEDQPPEIRANMRAPNLDRDMVRAYQFRVGLSVTGEIDDATRAHARKIQDDLDTGRIERTWSQPDPDVLSVYQDRMGLPVSGVLDNNTRAFLGMPFVEIRLTDAEVRALLRAAQRGDFDPKRKKDELAGVKTFGASGVRVKTARHVYSEADKLGLDRDDPDIRLAIELARVVLNPQAKIAIEAPPANDTGAATKRDARAVIQEYMSWAARHPDSRAARVIKYMQIAGRGPAITSEAE